MTTKAHAKAFRFIGNCKELLSRKSGVDFDKVYADLVEGAYGASRFRRITYSQVVTTESFSIQNWTSTDDSRPD